MVFSMISLTIHTISYYKILRGVKLAGWVAVF